MYFLPIASYKITCYTPIHHLCILGSKYLLLHSVPAPISTLYYTLYLLNPIVLQFYFNHYGHLSYMHSKALDLACREGLMNIVGARHLIILHMGRM